MAVSRLLARRLHEILPLQHLPRRVLAVLLRIEEAPAVLERRRHLRAEQSGGGGIAVRNVDAGDLVVAVVLEAGVLDGAEAGIDGRQRISALGEEADRLYA